MRRWPLRALIGLAVAYGALVMLARGACRSFVFPAPRSARAPAMVGATLVEFPASDGLVVHALEIDAGPNARTIVLFHGNGETIDMGASRARALVQKGLGVLLVEYRGYGASAGSPTEAGLYADAEGAMQYLASRGVSGDRVGIWGTSLGTGVAVEMARRHTIASLVLVTPFTSMTATVHDHAPFLPASLVVRDAFDTKSKCASVRAPTLVVHGDADGVVPFWMGEAVAACIAGAKLVHVPGGGHNDLFSRDPLLLTAIATHLAAPAVDHSPK